jgi:HEAT repeat protein
VRIAVVEALGFIGGRLSMTVLSAALKDKSPQVRIRAVEALKDAGARSIAFPISTLATRRRACACTQR